MFGRFRDTNLVVPVYKYPWIVALIRDDQVICSGTIISQKFILTAAECVFKPGGAIEPKCQLLIPPPECYHSPGELSIKLLGERTLGKTITIKSITPHLLFSYAKKMNNIALIELLQPLECSPTTSPICLPLNTHELKLGYNLSIAGWGTHAVFDYNGKYLDQFLVRKK
ncbi:hypothetical protein TNCV_4033721 [Trichonephila clavipes]|nr:hypothetical protein TNCV_4033721 [Trichonephila clavipes]